MSTNTTASVIRALRQATASEREQILQALGSTAAPATVHTQVSIAANVGALREAVPVLDERAAVALLADSSLHVFGGITKRDLTELLTDHLDQRWDELEPQMGELLLLCGQFGRSVLTAVADRVRRARRSRGAAEIAQVLALLELAQAKAVERAQADGELMAAGVGEEEAAELYQELLRDYARSLGGEVDDLVFGPFTASDVLLLRRCKRYLEEFEPGVMRRGWSVLSERLAVLFGRCRRVGMDPFTMRREREIRAERRQQPNVLFPGLRRGEPARWGGFIDDVNGKPDDGSQHWGGVQSYAEMHKAMSAWMERKAAEQGREPGADAGYLLP